MALRLRGAAVSAGVAVGRAHPLSAQPRPAPARTLSPRGVEAEVARLAEALDTAAGDLDQLRGQAAALLGSSYGGIFQVQKLILQDPDFSSRVVALMRRQRIAARLALQVVVQELVAQFQTLGDAYIRERGGELTDLHRRVDRLLACAPVPSPPASAAVVVARDLGPSDAFRLAREGAVGLAVDLGGRTSHTAILAQALSLPAVFGLRDLTRRLRGGEMLILDGDGGEVVVDPPADELARARRRRAAWVAGQARVADPDGLPLATCDGTSVAVRANIEFPDEVPRALGCGAEGIGLYRSEFLLLACAPGLPDEEQHFRTYVDIAARVAPHPAVVRTLDLGGEPSRAQALQGHAEPDPAGMRGVRFWLARPELLRPQLRGLLRAAARHPNLKALVPVVSAAGEVRRVRELIAQEVRDLAAEGRSARADLPLGLMIEVPAAALTADLLAREADFFSVGTNDLIQYALAVDRGSDALAAWFQPLHAGVLRMIEVVVRAAVGAGIPVGLCGEMAADPQRVPILLGLGLRELSVRPGALARVRQAVREADLPAAIRQAERAMAGDPPEPALC